MESVGERVRRYRRIRRLTQEQLADAAEVDRRYLGRIETGEVEQPGVEVVERLARALNVAVRQLADPRWYGDDPRGDLVIAGRNITGLTDDDLHLIEQFAERLRRPTES